MADVSNAFGEITLKGTWTPSMIANFNILCDECENWIHGITVEPFSADELTHQFTGNGRGCFASNLDYLSNWLVSSNNPVTIKAFNDLVTEMQANSDASICLYYTCP